MIQCLTIVAGVPDGDGGPDTDGHTHPNHAALPVWHHAVVASVALLTAPREERFIVTSLIFKE